MTRATSKCLLMVGCLVLLGALASTREAAAQNQAAQNQAAQDQAVQDQAAQNQAAQNQAGQNQSEQGRPAQRRPAQGRPARSPGMPGGRFEVSGGAGWAATSDLGTATATLTAPTGPPVTLFETNTEIEAGPRFDGRVAWRWTRSIAIEGSISVTRTHLNTSITGDFEQAGPATATERFSEYTFEGGVVFHLHRLALLRGRLRPFVTGGAGYLRQVHEGAIEIEEGQTGYAGGGVTVTLREARRPAFLDAIGLRGDIRLNLRSGGLEIEADRGLRLGSSASAGLFLRF